MRALFKIFQVIILDVVNWCITRFLSVSPGIPQTANIDFHWHQFFHLFLDLMFSIKSFRYIHVYVIRFCKIIRCFLKFSKVENALREDTLSSRLRCTNWRNIYLGYLSMSLTNISINLFCSIILFTDLLHYFDL